MIRAALIVAFACLAVPAHAEHRFNGDRYAWGGGMASDVVKAMRCPAPFSCRPIKPRKRFRKHSRRKHHRAPPLTLAGGFRREIARAAGQPSFVRGRLVCAVNVGRALASRGIKGTGSALAKSYLRWGHSSGPVAGAVAVFDRGKHGGHVALVDHVKPNGTVIYLNPSSSRQAWTIGPYRRRPIAFRVAT